MASDHAKQGLSVVLVTFNSADVVVTALEALATTSDVELVVVDNASADDSVAVVRRSWPDAVVIENSENVGFARAVNAGVRASSGALVMLLNPDAQIAPAAVELLRAAARAHPGDVVAPFIEQPAPQRIVSAGRMPTVWRMLTHYSGLSRLAPSVPLFEGHYLLPRQVHRTMSVQWVTGACFLVPRATWDDVGGLDERWFMYAEDIEFCLRVRRSGHRLWLVPAARAGHLVGRSDSRATATTNPAWVLNLRDFYATDLAPNRAAVALWTAVVAAGLAVRGALAALRRGVRNPAARSLLGYSSALLRRRR
ncbi:glycosyltransferase family 2 protein [Curtobacterium sp. MCLR17_036]|uniref:glycosyltransferase family 2 protein n=1 Tax=Curtobacterium sp. MCLR17_036 TaxID=2175620 RepID=UPI000DA9EDD7|nr:glycosyltransferase family 2 protein [Curtobacterium sp. MCLR17_036]WIE65413.1 glycosyltransferase family 2 protein [Curtobacterium sp. MCLR17_036]